MSHFSNLTIKRLIIHEVFSSNTDKTIVPPRLSNELIASSFPGLASIRERIVETMGSHSVEMKINSAGEDQTFQICASLLGRSDSEFVLRSKKIPPLLAEAQKTRPRLKGGNVIVLDGTIGGGVDQRRFIGIIKAEIHSGINQRQEQGTVSYAYLEKLFLTPAQKLLKMGFFVEDKPGEADVRDPNDFKVFVFDAYTQPQDPAAQYFGERFLGCTEAPTTDTLNKDLYRLTREFINGLDEPVGRKLQLRDQVYATMSADDVTQVGIGTFASKFGDQAKADDYREYMTQNGFPNVDIQKKYSAVKGLIGKTTMLFSSEIKITGPAGDFSTFVEVEKVEGGFTYLKVRGIEDKLL